MDDCKKGYNKAVKILNHFSRSRPASVSFSYCGIYSDISVFPAGKTVVMSVFLCDLVPIEIKAKLVVIGKNIVSSKDTTTCNQTHVVSFLLHHSLTNINFMTLVSKKHLRVCLNLHDLSPGLSVVVFNGPGILSNKLNFSSIELSCCSAFVCVVRMVFTGKNATSHSKSELHFQTLQSLSKTVDIFNNVKFVQGFDTAKKPQTKHLIFKFIAAENQTLNMTFKDFLLVEGQSVDCMFGGITVISRLKGTFEERYSLCNKGTFNKTLVSTYFFKEPSICRCPQFPPLQSNESITVCSTDTM